MSEENSAAAEEVSAATEEMSAQAEEVVATASELARMADALDGLVGRLSLAREVADQERAARAPTQLAARRGRAA